MSRVQSCGSVLTYTIEGDNVMVRSDGESSHLPMNQPLSSTAITEIPSSQPQGPLAWVGGTSNWRTYPDNPADLWNAVSPSVGCADSYLFDECLTTVGDRVCVSGADLRGEGDHWITVSQRSEHPRRPKRRTLNTSTLIGIRVAPGSGICRTLPQKNASLGIAVRRRVVVGS